MSFLALWSAAHPSQRVLLGGGSTREAWTLKACPDIVFKQPHKLIETFLRQQRNEWRTWLYCADKPELAQHLAPCFECAPDFSVLVMARTKQPQGYAGSGWQYPRLPDWLASDMYCDNVGDYCGRIVLHDYGYQGRAVHSAPVPLEACR